MSESGKHRSEAEQNVDAQQAADALLQDTRPNGRRRTAAASAGVLAVAGAAGLVSYYAARNGVDVSSVLDAQFAPQPDVYPGIVDGFVAVNNGLRAAAPFVAVAGLATQAGHYIAGKRDGHAAAVNMLSRTDYAGTEGIMKSDANPTLLDRMRRRSAAVGVGLIATSTAGMTGGMSGVEHEVSNGPLRPIVRTFDALSTTTGDRDIIVQSPTTTFMDDSWLDHRQMQAVVTDAAKEGMTVVPFTKTLPNIDGRSGLAIAVPDEAFATIIGRKSILEDGCERPPVVLDNANTTPVGEDVNINGQQFEVVEKISGTAQMNRDIAIIPETAADECIVGESSAKTPYFGAIVSGRVDTKALRTLLQAHGLDRTAIVSESQFDDNNRSFWRKNGTPIILQLIGCVGVLGGAAMMSLRRSKLIANAREIAILKGQGVADKDIRQAEFRRSLRESAVSTLVATPFMFGLAASFNAAEVGLKVGVGLREVLSGYTVTMLANILGSRRAAKHLEKNLDVAEAVKKG